jgi:hypothetical protein
MVVVAHKPAEAQVVQAVQAVVVVMDNRVLRA